jgi:hypothetical protein
MAYPRIIPDADPPFHATLHIHTLRNLALMAHPPFPPMGKEPPSGHFVAASYGGLAISYAIGMAALIVVAP